MDQLRDLAGGLFTETRFQWSRRIPNPYIERCIERGRRHRLAGIKEANSSEPEKDQQAVKQNPATKGYTPFTQTPEIPYLPPSRQSIPEQLNPFYH